MVEKTWSKEKGFDVPDKISEYTVPLTETGEVDWADFEGQVYASSYQPKIHMKLFKALYAHGRQDALEEAANVAERPIRCSCSDMKDNRSTNQITAQAIRNLGNK